MKEYTQKGVYMQTELRANFLTLRCPDKGNAKDFLRGLRLKKEELAQVGVTISDEDYLSTIILSLPDALSNFALSQIAWTAQQNSKLMDTNVLMLMLLQEADRQYLRSLRQKVGSAKGKEEEKNEALVVDQSKGKKERDLSLIDCWNCGDKGHFRLKCSKPKKSTTDAKRPAEANSNSKGNSGPRTASAVEETSNEEGAWAAYKIMNEVVSDEDWFEQTSDNNSNMPELEEVSDSNEEGDEVMLE